jgi:hypothetical protein
MVVDLGATHALAAAVLHWTHGRAPAATVSVSSDGLAWQPAGAAGRDGRVPLEGSARYVAVDVPSGRRGDGALAELEVQPG